MAIMKRMRLLVTMTALLGVGMAAFVFAAVGCEQAMRYKTDYGIELDVPTTFTFPNANEGYGEADANAAPIIITNIGKWKTRNLTIALSGGNSTLFTVTPTEIPSIPVGKVAMFSVKPAAGLPLGTYTANVTVSGTHDISASFEVRFTVGNGSGGSGGGGNSGGSGALSIYLDGGDTFPYEGEGYAVLPAKKITLINNGSTATGELTLSVSNSIPSGDFTLNRTWIPSLASGESAIFTVKPATGLPEGIYSARITVSGANITAQSFDVSFTVSNTTPPPYYPPSNSGSYLALNGGNTVELDVYDLSALCSDITEGADIIVNGQSVRKNTITKVVFGPEFASVTTLPDNFCGNFNNLTELDLSGLTGLTSIGGSFLFHCTSFNQPLTIPRGVTVIGPDFLTTCESFNSALVLPSGLTSLGAHFLYGCGAFNQPLTLPSGLTYLRDNFLMFCKAFNQPITFPPNITTIGEHVMAYCYAFNQPLVVPGSVIGVGRDFLSDSRAMTSTVTINCPAAAFAEGIYTFCTNTDDSANFYNGVKIAGPYTASIMARFPNSNSSPYRHLIAQ